MVTKGYMLDKPPPPPAWKRFVDLELVPRAANALGSVEAVLETIAVHARARPSPALAAAFGVGCGLAFLSRARSKQ